MKPSQSKRVERIEEMLQRKLAQLIPLEVRDPRLPNFITVTGVKLAADLSHAKIYFVVMKDEQAIAVTILNKAAGCLRSALARTSKLRTLPKLEFVYDASLEYGDRLSRLIDDANAEDDSSKNDLSEDDHSTQQ